MKRTILKTISLAVLICSLTLGALLTERNHHRISAGQISEFANDWDGYAGIQPKIWREMDSFSLNSICLVLASETYDSGS